MTAFRNNGLTAHRGNPAGFPENTLPGFADGLASGADWLETDVHRTRDGQVVVCHDATTGRTADGDLVIAESTLAELKRLDFSAGFRRARGLNRSSCPPTCVPLLSEVLALLLWQGQARLSIQLKAPIAGECAAVIRDLRAEGVVGFNEGRVAWLDDLRRQFPEAPIFHDVTGRGEAVDELIEQARSHRFQALVMYHEHVTAEMVRRVRAAGLEFGAWNVATPARMRALVRLGVWRLYADAPRALAAVLRREGRSL